MIVLSWLAPLGGLALVAASPGPTRTVYSAYPFIEPPQRTLPPLPPFVPRRIRLSGRQDNISISSINNQISSFVDSFTTTSSAGTGTIFEPGPCPFKDGITGLINVDDGRCLPDFQNTHTGDICTFRNGTTGVVVATTWDLSCELSSTDPKPGDACSLYPNTPGVSYPAVAAGIVNSEGQCRCPDGSAPNSDFQCTGRCTRQDGSPGTLGPDKECNPIECTKHDGTKSTIREGGSCGDQLLCPDGQKLSADGKKCETSCPDGQKLSADGKKCETSCPDGQKLSTDGKKCETTCPESQKLSADGKKCEPICVKNMATGKNSGGKCVYAGDECDLPDGTKGIYNKDFVCEKPPATGTECEVINGQKGVYVNGMCTWTTKPDPNTGCTGTDGKKGKMTADGKCDVGGTVTPPKEQSTCQAAGSIGLTPKGVGVVVNGTCTVYTRPDGQTYFPPGTINPPQAAAEAVKSAASGIPKWGIAVAAAGGAVVLVAVAVTISCQCEWDHDRHKLRRKKKKRTRRDEEEARRREEDRIREDERRRMSMLQMQQAPGYGGNMGYAQQQQYYDPYKPR